MDAHEYFLFFSKFEYFMYFSVDGVFLRFFSSLVWFHIFGVDQFGLVSSSDNIGSDTSVNACAFHVGRSYYIHISSLAGVTCRWPLLSQIVSRFPN
jgi:hypothetical protein